MRLKYERISDGFYRIFHNNHRIGEFIRGDDGYLSFFLHNYNGGGFEEWILRDLADELKRINEPWDRQICEDLEKLQKEYCDEIRHREDNT